MPEGPPPDDGWQPPAPSRREAKDAAAQRGALEPPEDYIQKANRLYREGRVQEAVEEWNEEMGIFRARGSEEWQLVQEALVPPHVVHAPPEVLRESDDNLIHVHQALYDKVDFLVNRIAGFTQEQVRESHLPFLQALANLTYPAYGFPGGLELEPADLGLPEPSPTHAAAAWQQQQPQQQQGAGWAAPGGAQWGALQPPLRQTVLIPLERTDHQQQQQQQRRRRQQQHQGDEEKEEGEAEQGASPPLPPPPPLPAGLAPHDPRWPQPAHAAESQGTEPSATPAVPAAPLPLPAFALARDQLGPELHAQLRQAQWAEAVAAVAAAVAPPGHEVLSDPEDPEAEWVVVKPQPGSTQSAAELAGTGAKRGDLRKLRACARKGEVAWGTTILRLRDKLRLPLREEPYALQDLYWSGTDHLDDFLVARGQLQPLLPPGASDAERAAALQSAAAAVPGLVVPARERIAERCDAAQTEQGAVVEDMKAALQHVMGLSELAGSEAFACARFVAQQVAQGSAAQAAPQPASSAASAASSSSNVLQLIAERVDSVAAAAGLPTPHSRSSPEAPAPAAAQQPAPCEGPAAIEVDPGSPKAGDAAAALRPPPAAAAAGEAAAAGAADIQQQQQQQQQAPEAAASAGRSDATAGAAGGLSRFDLGAQLMLRQHHEVLGMVASLADERAAAAAAAREHAPQRTLFGPRPPLPHMAAFCEGVVRRTLRAKGRIIRAITDVVMDLLPLAEPPGSQHRQQQQQQRQPQGVHRGAAAAAPPPAPSQREEQRLGQRPEQGALAAHRQQQQQKGPMSGQKRPQPGGANSAPPAKLARPQHGQPAAPQQAQKQQQQQQQQQQQAHRQHAPPGGKRDGGAPAAGARRAAASAGEAAGVPDSLGAGALKLPAAGLLRPDHPDPPLARLALADARRLEAFEGQQLQALAAAGLRVADARELLGGLVEEQMRAVVDHLLRHDKRHCRGTFSDQVSAEEVKGYYEDIKHPMWLRRIKEALDRGHYALPSAASPHTGGAREQQHQQHQHRYGWQSLVALGHDVALVGTNALLFNEEAAGRSQGSADVVRWSRSLMQAADSAWKAGRQAVLQAVAKQATARRGGAGGAGGGE